MAAAAEEGRPATKYVLITGGVVSGLGKGVTASSVGVVLKSCGLRVTCIKIGPLPLPLPLPLHVFSLPKGGHFARFMVGVLSSARSA
jgi:hypothetical protein